jgi:hypothetical protein
MFLEVRIIPRGDPLPHLIHAGAQTVAGLVYPEACDVPSEFDMTLVARLVRTPAQSAVPVTMLPCQFRMPETRDADASSTNAVAKNVLSRQIVFCHFSEVLVMREKDNLSSM